MENVISNIIIIDDSKIDRLIEKKVIETTDYRGFIKTYVSADDVFKEGIGKIFTKSKGKQVVFCDNQMPGRTGVQFANEVSQSTIADIYDFYLVSSTLYEEVLRSIEKNSFVHDTIPKPLPRVKVENILHQYAA